MGIWSVLSAFLCSIYSTQGWIQGGGAHPACSPLKLKKIWFFYVKSWFFTRNTMYPQNFRASLRSARLLKVRPLEILDPPLVTSAMLVGWLDKILKLHPIRITQAMVSLKWPSCVWREDFQIIFCIVVKNHQNCTLKKKLKIYKQFIIVKLQFKFRLNLVL